MATVNNNPFVQNASGAVGKLLVYKKYADKTVISKMPDMSHRVLSEKQIESNKRMKLANFYAKRICKSEEEKAKAQLRLNPPAHKSLFHALVREFMIANKDQR